jgi:hypothetical protein
MRVHTTRTLKQFLHINLFVVRNNNNSTLFVCVPIQRPKGQLQSKHRLKIEKISEETDKTNKTNKGNNIRTNKFILCHYLDLTKPVPGGIFWLGGISTTT